MTRRSWWPWHCRATRFINVLTSGRVPFLIDWFQPDFVVCEFVNALSGPEERPKAHRVLEWLRRQDEVLILEATRTWIDSGLTLHAARPDKSWSLTDCISFEVMAASSITQALTNDHHFEQAGFEALLCRDPS